ncbi:hypothetical protein QR90_05775 [Deinococcus radiopugnans]|uniref:Uncharacterized protein n=1 Tax=Deinococcus radiopugnans TaxID=57497 RepID=A0A0A7KJG9_9DEIO|nr:hypothetical protein [Deinococcus radiopugnans]AIZ44713.1 hypothetical protein QR90_05775 [Deinococcus radiopugnans]
MTPDDWQKGMENEAASVEDGEWAIEARRAARANKMKRTGFVLTAATLLYVLIGSLMVMAFNALSIGYGPQGLRAVVLGSPLPSFLTGLLIPLLTTAYLVRLGVRPALVWPVPIVGAVLGAVVSGLLTIAVPLNFQNVMPGEPVDLLPSGTYDMAQILSSLAVTALAVALGIGLGQWLRRQNRRTLA